MQYSNIRLVSDQLFFIYLANSFRQGRPHFAVLIAFLPVPHSSTHRITRAVTFNYSHISCSRTHCELASEHIPKECILRLR